MPNSEILLRTILGPVRPRLRPLALAIDIAGELLFTQHISMDDIQAKSIYQDVARQFPCKQSAASRRIERLSHLCWDALKSKGLVPFYLGSGVIHPPEPLALIIYLAVYARLEVPFSTAIDRNPHFLFQSPSDINSISGHSAPSRDYPLPVSQILAFRDSSGTLYFPACPGCGITLEREYQNFCDRCGQRLNWNHFNDAVVIFPDHTLHS